MATIAQGVFKKLFIKLQTGLGTSLSDGDGAAQSLRRVTSTIDLAKETYKSNEILPSQQHRDFRHGVRSVSGTITGELSGGTYQQLMRAILRKAFTGANPTSATYTNTMIARATSDTTGVFTDSTATFISDGWRVGMVARFSGWLAHTAYGTASGATTNTAGYSIGATSVTLASAGTGTFIAGDAIRFTGDTTDYIIQTGGGDADVSNGGTLTFSPGLVSAIPASATAITIQTTTSATNNAHNFLITSLSETSMYVRTLDGVGVISKDTVIDNDAVSIAAISGKYSFIPSSGHIEDYLTIEHEYSDLDTPLSELFTDCVPSQMNIKLPPSGMATIDFPIVGLNMDVSRGSPYYSAGAGVVASSTSGLYAAINGAVYVGGNAIANITNIDISVNGNVASMGGVVGTNVAPDIQRGTLEVTGTMSVFFENATMRDYFINETEVAISIALTASTSANAEFMAITMPRVKIGGASKDDGQKGLVMTMPFTALEMTTAASITGYTPTTIFIHDSLAA